MRTSRRLGATLGVVSAVSGLAVSELLSGLLHQRVSPIIAVAEGVIALTPGQVAEFFISLVGNNDKPLLIGMTIAGLLVLSAAVGMLALRFVVAAEGAFIAMGVIAILAVNARLTSSASTYVPAIVGTV
ncbi:MAG: hypothetical protein M3Q82_08290, partial [Actinomycetota bacterium]|nr:hypothetical protein [Actinomycetota bacterium]